MYQITDDSLDVTASAKMMGKKTAKDAKRGKARWADFYAPERIGEMLDEHARAAKKILRPFGARVATLGALVDFIATRER